jgi:hypothetical protein
MRNHLFHFSTVVSSAYFVLVMLVLVWYETSLGGLDNSGLIPGLLLVLITAPGSFFSGWSVSLFGCVRYSTCEHVVGSLFAGALNALLIFVVLRSLSLKGRKKDAT